MPHDDWVRLWVLTVGVPVELAFGLSTARYLYWHVLDDDDRRNYPRNGGETLAMTLVVIFWFFFVLVYGACWVITHEPRRALDVSDQRKGFLDIVNEGRDTR